jgi:hypothetical protein
MSFIGIIIFGLILLLITLYIIVYVIYPGSGNNDLLPKMAKLNEKKEIYTADVTQSTLLSTTGSTVMGFFYLKDGDKTSKYTDNFTPLIQIENNWFLEISPSPVGNGKSAARLRVKTNDAGSLKDEIIELPQIPKQKWQFIAILREGRRFDVIYDNEIVASQRLESYPVVISSPLSVGNIRLDGVVIHIMVNGTRLSPNMVERERITHIDTTNTVIEGDIFDKTLPGYKLLAQCPPGLPCNTITKPPSNNLLEWKTPYA